MIYKDIIDTEITKVLIDKEIRQYINKGTAHISMKRGALSFDNTKYFNIIKDVLFAIRDFLEALDTKIKPEFRSMLCRKDIEEIGDIVGERLYKACECLISDTGE